MRDGELQTACQAACPAEAIIFGDINVKKNEVAQTKASPPNYTLLTDLNTYPRTSYQAKLSNPNPDLKGSASKDKEANAPKGV